MKKTPYSNKESDVRTHEMKMVKIRMENLRQELINRELDDETEKMYMESLSAMGGELDELKRNKLHSKSYSFEQNENPFNRRTRKQLRKRKKINGVSRRTLLERGGSNRIPPKSKR